MIAETGGTFKREFAGTTYFPLLQIIIWLEAPRPPVLGPGVTEGSLSVDAAASLEKEDVTLGI